MSLVRCINERCRALYNDSAKWVRVIDLTKPNDTTGRRDYLPLSMVNYGHCPLCLTKQGTIAEP